MWFKQASIFQFTRPLKIGQQQLSDALAPLSFTPCLPSLPSSIGWVSPIKQTDGALVYGSKRYWMICLQFEEKLLPADIIRQALDEKIADIEQKETRVVRGKEKQSLKDELTQTLLPRAFTKKLRIHGYIDLEHHWLIINSNTPAKVERFTAFLKRALVGIELKLPDIKKPTAIMTNWLKEKEPKEFGIGQSGVLQDPQQQRRVIRCQHQDLGANGIQSLLKEGCEISQLALTWKNQMQFVLTSEFALRSIQFQDAVVALSKSNFTENTQQRFDADFVIMTEVLTQMIEELHGLFAKNPAVLEAVAA